MLIVVGLKQQRQFTRTSLPSNLLINFNADHNSHMLVCLELEITCFQLQHNNSERDLKAETGELRQAGKKKAQITFPLGHFFPLKVVK
jgi:hypothetical protein